MLDSANDEPALAGKNRAVRKFEYNVDADGTIALNGVVLLYQTGHGHVIETVYAAQFDDLRIYVFSDFVAVLEDDTLLGVEDGGYADGTVDVKPREFLNKYDPAETLLAVREENGGYVFLSDAGDGRICEYVTDARLKYIETRTYEKDADGVPRLTWFSRNEIIDAPGLPDAVADLIR